LTVWQVSKMKVTITCRFSLDGIETDNEADCRFFFLLDKREGRWKISFYTLLFDKDKMIPVNPNKVSNVFLCTEICLTRSFRCSTSPRKRSPSTLR
jgi:hypothetical protein